MDKKEKKPQSGTSGTILSAVLFMALGAGVGYALLENESFFAVFLFGLAGLCVSFALQTTQHETGHLIGGLLTGYKFCSFRIGNLQLQRENGALAIDFGDSVAGYGAYTTAVPDDAAGARGRENSGDAL